LCAAGCSRFKDVCVEKAPFLRHYLHQVKL
jgi:hypothetical protein